MATPKENISLGFAWVVSKLNTLFALIPTNTSDLTNDGGDTFSPFVQEDGLKTVNGNSLIGSGNLPITTDATIPDYADIASLLAGQGAQIEDGVYGVANASADPNLTFPTGETRLQAYYRYLGTTNGTMVDYELISAPYGNHTEPFDPSAHDLDEFQNVSPNPYVRQSGLPNSFPEAPQDGKNYGRENGAWVEGKWNLQTNSVQRTTVPSGGILDLIESGFLKLTYGAGGQVTFSIKDTEFKTSVSDISKVKTYSNYNNMVADLANQSTDFLLYVTDASGDSSLTFPSGETNKWALYKKNGGIGTSHLLVAAPFAQIKAGQIPIKAITNARMADMPSKTIKGRKETTAGAPQDLTPAQVKEMLGIDQFTTQTITSGGNYNDLEVTADLLVFTNENAQAVLNGIWGRKEFHILNLSSQYEILINHDSSSVSGNGQPIMLPTNSGTAGIKGTARVLQTDSYGYFVADTWGSKYRPEFSELTEDKVMLVGADHRAKAEDIIELKFYRTNQSTTMDSTELEIAYPNSIQGTEVICTPINKKYEKIDNLGNWVEIDFATV